MALIKGETIILFDKVDTGRRDECDEPSYIDLPAYVHNVLIGNPSTEDIATELHLSGKRIAYELCIPKGDTHIWKDRKVEFWGMKFRTIGFPTQLMESNVPLEWNKKVKVEQYE